MSQSIKKLDFKKIGNSISENKKLNKVDLYDLIENLVNTSIENNENFSEKDKRVAKASISVLKEIIKD